MLESMLRVRNFCWPDAESERWWPSGTDDAAELRGQFSIASTTPQGSVTLVRDRLGLNKLFFAIHQSGTVQAANYLIDLVGRGVPVEAIYSVPAGHSLEIDPRHQTLTLCRYFAVESLGAEEGAGGDDLATTIRRRLEVWFSRLSERFNHRRICVSLSGGVDSSVVAAFARQYFPDVTAYTYGFVDSYGTKSEDVGYAQQVARLLQIPFRFVPASSQDVLEALESALCYGQDWRDFNVHCAIVNEILARAISSDAGDDDSDEPPLVLTGDLANELFADYTSVSYDGREYYRLPKVGPGELRMALIRGLDAGDREIGIFNHHGIDVIEPYGLLLEEYLSLPAGSLRDAQCKQNLSREIAGDLLPDFVFDRVKVRAQIGSSTDPGGIVPVLARNGFDSAWLRRAFCRLLSIREEAFLSRLVRAGRYRFMTAFPTEEWRIGGYRVA